MFGTLRFRLTALFLSVVFVFGLVSMAFAVRLFQDVTRSESVSELKREAAGLADLYAESALRSSDEGARAPEFAAKNLELATGDELYYVGASLFPGQPAVRERDRWVVAERIAEVDAWRITLTPPLLNAAAEVLFLVLGADKAPMLKRVLEGPMQPDELPAQVVAPHDGTLTWLVDAAAARDLTS